MQNPKGLFPAFAFVANTPPEGGLSVIGVSSLDFVSAVPEPVTVETVGAGLDSVFDAPKLKMGDAAGSEENEGGGVAGTIGNEGGFTANIDGLLMLVLLGFESNSPLFKFSEGTVLETNALAVEAETATDVELSEGELTCSNFSVFLTSTLLDSLIFSCVSLPKLFEICCLELDQEVWMGLADSPEGDAETVD